MKEESFDIYYGSLLDKIDKLDGIFNPIISVPSNESDTHGHSDWIVNVDKKINQVIKKEKINSILLLMLYNYILMNKNQQKMIREIFEEYESFSWSVYLFDKGNIEDLFFNQVLLFSIINSREDTRDIIMNLDSFCNRARENKINYKPIFKKIALMSSNLDLYGMGSMQQLLMESAGD